MRRWPTKPLGEVCEFVRGISFKPTDLVEVGSPDSLACFRTKNVQADLEAGDLLYIPRSFVRTDRQLVKEGDTLISTANSNNLVGKCCFVPPLDYPATLGGFIAAIRSDPSQMRPRFLYYWLASPPMQMRFRGLARQTTNISNLPLTDVAKERAPVPPLTEQERIVKLLDEADELLKLRAQSDHRTSALISALFHEMFGDQEINPNHWPRVKVQDAVDLINGRAFKPTEWSKSGLPIIRIQNLKDSTAEFNHYDGQFELKHRVKKGALLISWAGQLVSFGVHIWDGPEGVLNQHIFKVEPKLPFEIPFLQHALSHVVEAAKSHFQGSEMKHLTRGTLDEAEVLSPPLPLQEEFTQRVTEIRKLEGAQAASRRRLEALSKSLLHCAFQGEL